MTIEERLDALTMKLELTARAGEDQRGRIGQILLALEALVVVTKSHEGRRLDSFGG